MGIGDDETSSDNESEMEDENDVDIPAENERVITEQRAESGWRPIIDFLERKTTNANARFETEKCGLRSHQSDLASKSEIGNRTENGDSCAIEITSHGFVQHA